MSVERTETAEVYIDESADMKVLEAYVQDALEKLELGFLASRYRLVVVLTIEEVTISSGSRKN